jgi:hypothetical protein
MTKGPKEIEDPREFREFEESPDLPLFTDQPDNQNVLQNLPEAQVLANDSTEPARGKVITDPALISKALRSYGQAYPDPVKTPHPADGYFDLRCPPPAMVLLATVIILALLW